MAIPIGNTNKTPVIVQPPTGAYVPKPTNTGTVVNKSSLNTKPSYSPSSTPNYQAPTTAIGTISPVNDPGDGSNPLSYEELQATLPEIAQVGKSDLQQAALAKLVQFDPTVSDAFYQQAANERANAEAALGDRGYGHSAEFMGRDQGPASLINPEAASGIAPDITNPAIPDPIPPRPTNRSQVVNGTAPIISGPSVDQGGQGGGIGEGVGSAGQAGIGVGLGAGLGNRNGRPFAMSQDDLRRSAAARLGI